MQFQGLFSSERFQPNVVHLSNDTGSFLPHMARVYTPPSRRRVLSERACRPPPVETALPFMFGTRHVAPRGLDEALQVAQGLLEGMYGSQQTGKPTGATESKKKGMTASQPAAVETAKQPEKKTDKSESGATAADKDNTSVEQSARRRPLWTRALSVPGFSPEEIEVKVKEGKVNVHARHEEACGASSCLSRMEMVHSVALPENVEQQSLACSLRPDGKLMLRAPVTDKLRLENKTDGMKALENKPQKVPEALEDTTEKAKPVEDKTPKREAVEDKTEKREALEDKSEKREFLENKAKRIEALTSLTEKLITEVLNTEGDDYSHVEIPVEPEVVESLLAEAAKLPELFVETLRELSAERENGKKEGESTEKKEALDVSAGDSSSDHSSVGRISTSNGEFEIISESEMDSCPKDGSPRGRAEEAAGDAGSTPPVKSVGDVQKPAASLFRTSLPLAGFSPGNITIKIQDYTLRVTAERQAWFEDSAYTESIERRVELPKTLDTSSIRCLYMDSGELVITARPKVDEQQVPVESKEG